MSSIAFAVSRFTCEVDESVPWWVRCTATPTGGSGLQSARTESQFTRSDNSLRLPKSNAYDNRVAEADA